MSYSAATGSRAALVLRGRRAGSVFGGLAGGVGLRWPLPGPAGIIGRSYSEVERSSPVIWARPQSSNGPSGYQTSPLCRSRMNGGPSPLTLIFSKVPGTRLQPVFSRRTKTSLSRIEKFGGLWIRDVGIVHSFRHNFSVCGSVAPDFSEHSLPFCGT